MAWVESHTVLARHRKTLELSFDLKIKPVEVVGHLHVFWHTVLEQQEDGDLSKWSDQLIAQAALWEGDATEFVSCLRKRGWLDGHLVHDWIDYVGPFLTRKYSSGNLERLKEIWLKHGYKYGKGQGKYNKKKATPKREVSEQKKRLPFPSSPNPSEPNQTLPPEEEVRFEELFWKPYPDRNGKKLEKAAAKLLFLALSVDDQRLACTAVTHYAASLKQQGISAKDPKRFLRDGKGLEPWRDWIEPPAPPAPSPRIPPPQVKCAWVNGGACEDYAKPNSKYCEPHGVIVKKAQDRRSADLGPTRELVNVSIAGITEKIGRAM